MKLKKLYNDNYNLKPLFFSFNILARGYKYQDKDLNEIYSYYYENYKSVELSLS